MLNSGPTQVQTFLDKTSHISGPKHDPKIGKVPFQTAMQLTFDEEQALVERVLQRTEQMENELGRNLVTMNMNWFSASTNVNLDRQTFMGRRSLWEMAYQNKVWYRRYTVGGIFKESNLTAPFSRRIVRQMTARAVNYYFGTDPWFASYPIGGDREELAEELDEYSQFKTERSDLKSTFAKAIEGAFVRGESVIKTTWQVDESMFQQNANVLVDENGLDILDANKDYITDRDAFADQYQWQTDPKTGERIPESKTPTGQKVLRRDLKTIQPPDPTYAQKKITRKRTRFRGAKSEVVYWQDLLIPQTAADVQSADIVAHLSDLPVADLIDMYQRKGLLEDAPVAQMEATQRAMDLLRKMAADSGQPKSALGQARVNIGESYGYVGWQDTEPKAQIIEAYLKWDANQDGQGEQIVIVVDRKNRTAIYYDYLDNVTPDGERPFDVIRIQPIEGRWYGMGAMEMFDKSQRSIDLLLNRWNLAQGQAGRVTFWDPSCVVEGDRNPHLVMNMGNTYTLKPGKTMDQALGFKTLPEVKGDDIQKLMQFIQQLMMNESGITNVNDGASAGLDTAKLATGVRNMQNQGEEMFSLYISSLEPSLRSCTRRNLKVEFANMREQEVYSFFEGDQHKVGVLMQEDVADLDINVSILLTRYRNQQLLQSAQMAANAAAQFFGYPPAVQQRVVPLYVQILKALQIDDPGSIIVVAPPHPQLPGQPGQPSAPGAIPPPAGGEGGDAGGDAASGLPTQITGQIQPGKFLLTPPSTGA